MKPKRNLPFRGVLLLCAVLLSPLPSMAQSPSAPKVIGVAFYADWCPGCKELGPKMGAVMKDVAGLPVYFTRFDLTNEQTKTQSALFAQWTGLGSIYRENSSGTGYVLLIDAQQKKVVGKLMHTQSEAELTAAIRRAVAQTAPSGANSSVRQNLHPAP